MSLPMLVGFTTQPISLPMPADFAIRLAGGLAALLIITPWRVVPPAFFRTHCQIILGLTVLATLDIARGGVPSWMFPTTCVLAVLAFVATIGWGLGLLRVGIPAAWGIALTSAALLLGSPAEQTLALQILNGASRLASSFLLGSTLTAMLLGHYYLTSPAMSIAPLVKFTRCMATALGVRLILGLIALGFVATHATPGVSGLFLAIRWGMGFAGPGLATLLAWKTVEIRSTQSATGILYIAMTLVLFGELTSLILATGGGVLI